jgi:hypothetical protein
MRLVQCVDVGTVLAAQGQRLHSAEQISEIDYTQPLAAARPAPCRRGQPGNSEIKHIEVRLCEQYCSEMH